MNEGKRGYKVIKHVATPKLPATKPRNFVAKNSTTSGAGAHKDKKKAAKQGDHKHKKTPADMLEGAAYDRALELQLKMALVESLLDENGYGSNRGYRQGFASPTAPSLRGRGREDDEGNSEFDDKMRKITGKIFYNVNDPDMASSLGLKQTRTGKWYLPVGNRNAQKAADSAFGPGKVWYPKNESMAEHIDDGDYNAEYDDEAGMVDNNLETLKRAVQGLDNLVSAGDNLPEWCQEKIAVSKSMLIAVWDYMASEEERMGKK